MKKVKVIVVVLVGCLAVGTITYNCIQKIQQKKIRSFISFSFGGGESGGGGASGGW